MGTFRSGLSTSGLASSPPPAQAFTRRMVPGEYMVNVTLSSSGKVELITTPERLNGLIIHLGDVLTEMLRDQRVWDAQLDERGNPHHAVD